MIHSAKEILNSLNKVKAPAQCRYKDIFKLCENCTDEAFAVQFNAFINGMSVNQVKRLLSEPNKNGSLPIHKLIYRDMIKGVSLLLEWGRAFDLSYKVDESTIMDAACSPRYRVSGEMLGLVLTHTNDPNNQHGVNNIHPMVLFVEKQSNLFALLNAGATVEDCFDRHPLLSSILREKISSARRDWLAEELIASEARHTNAHQNSRRL